LTATAAAARSPLSLHDALPIYDRKFEIAIREIEVAQRLSPTSPSILANKALILHHAGRHDEALAILEPLAAAQPELLSPASYLRSEEHTSELQSRENLVCRPLL